MEVRFRVTRAKIGALAGALALVLTGVALGVTSNAYTDAQGVYHGCVGTDSGQLRMLAEGESCKNSETAIDWNQVGSQGIRGLQGEKGAKGDKGDTGIQGIQGEKGDKGDQGMQGPPGAGLVGSACLVPEGLSRLGGGDGTVQMTVAESGAISFTRVVPDGGGGGGTPSPEVCDGVDNDLDGTIDDGDPGGGGLGSNGGIIHCVGGSLVEVGGTGGGGGGGGTVDNDLDGYPADGDCDDSQATVYPGAPEVLNSIDDNCDGRVDEDVWVPYAFGSDVGACEAGLINITTGEIVGAVGPSVEIANEIDDDCDGVIDDGV